MSLNRIKWDAAERLFLGLVLLLLLPGAGFAQKVTRYKDAEFHYSFDVPAGWLQNKEMPRPMVAFAGPKANDFVINVNITSESVGDITLAQYTKAAKIQVEKANKDQNINVPTQKNVQKNVQIDRLTVYEEKAVKLGGVPAHAWRLHVNLPNRPLVEERQVFCVHGGRAYAITFTTRKPDMKKNEAVFETLLASFRWDK